MDKQINKHLLKYSMVVPAEAHFAMMTQTQTHEVKTICHSWYFGCLSRVGYSQWELQSVKHM